MRRQWRMPRFIVWFAVAVLVIAVLGTSAVLVYLGLQPAVTVSSPTAHPGDQIVVTARHVPSGQTGQIQAFGTSEDFTAGTSGDVSVEFLIPVDTAPGSYTVSMCWNATCYASTGIQILPGVTSTPTAEASPSPSASSPPAGVSITVSPNVGIVPGRTSVLVTATGLAPGAATITAGQATTRQSWTGLIAANGTMSLRVVLATSQPWAKGAGFIQVCDVQYRCTAAATIAIG